MNKTWKYIALFVMTLMILLLIIAFGAYPFLTAERHMDADILVVEGWQSEEALENAAELFLTGNYRMLITTGGRKVSSHYLEQDHHLKFIFDKEPENRPGNCELLINVSGINGASFEIYADDSVLLVANVTGDPQDFRAQLHVKPVTINVRTSNNRKIDPGVANIFIKYIRVDGRDIHTYPVIVYDEDTSYLEDILVGEVLQVMQSPRKPIDHANNAKEKLIELGVPFEFTLAAPGDSIGSERTKHNANGLRKKLETEGLLESNFTLFTTGIHARRSRILYEQALGKEIGVIVFQDPVFPPYSWWTDAGNWKRIMKELSGCFYYGFIENSE